MVFLRKRIQAGLKEGVNIIEKIASFCVYTSIIFLAISICLQLLQTG
jgi:hypothetical protein